MPRVKLDLPENFAFATEVQVEISDINYGGHLGNDKILSFLHEARVRFLGQFGFTELDVDGAGTIMADAVIVYKSEAFHGDTLKIEVTTGGFHKVGCDFYYRLSNTKTGQNVALAKTGIVFFDYKERKMLPVPEKFKQLCGSYNQ